ncbi:Putative lipoprotein/NMB1162 precursor [Marinomonas gallaica]|uniref:Lipoprotein/NMB1162 n=1 Tax=Marinomonas gallaica TaxID=1806667 RepID=A0A1C3JPP4_9GAMM|nr:GNA1162 family protein [Marinomonas gallaica]SBT17060.1 Putative lipoprotein/NMB1162 precursor [Marinomonas gallaica]SBT20633.1 Putative lipoprotein/NMB1162 precursor [Marinomonas gallaica]
MTSIKALTLLSSVLITLFLTGCSTPPSYNYDALLASEPRSILIIPPKNNSVEVNAPYIYLSTISRPFGEKGYYIFPVAVIDAFLKENGLPTPEEMNFVPLDKLYEHIGADAVLYTEINDWGQKYKILSSETVVDVSMTLLDGKTGALLWNARASAVRSSDSGGGGLLGNLINAVATQIINSYSDQTPTVARAANNLAINQPSRGLLNGPYALPKE